MSLHINPMQNKLGMAWAKHCMGMHAVNVHGVRMHEVSVLDEGMSSIDVHSLGMHRWACCVDMPSGRV
jgi:hypothetical protein